MSLVTGLALSPIMFQMRVMTNIENTKKLLQ